MADARSQLLAALQEAASQDYVRMRRAEEQLKQWENEPHFFAALQDIFYDPSVDHDVRFLGGIYLKNGVERFWRKTAKHPIHPDEKTAIRTRLVGFLKEPSKKLTAQNAVIASRIARMDYPRDWPDVLPRLVQSVEAPDTTNEQEIKIVHDRAFDMLYEVLLGLSSRPLSAARKQFAEVAPRVFQTAANAYVVYTKSTIQELSSLSASSSTEKLSLELNIATTCVKCLRILLVNGIRDVHKYDETKTFIEMSKVHIQELLQRRAAIQQHDALMEALETLIDEHGALYLALQKAHPVSCAVCPAWPDILAFYWHYIVQEGNRINDRYKPGEPMNISIYEQFLLQGMLLIKDTIRNFGLSTDASTSDLLSVTDEEKALAAEARNIIRSRFLTDEFVNSCIETLISKYMLLSPSDLERWEEDPEGWAGSIESENWEFELRPCAEMTLVNLLSQYRDQLCPIILDLVEKVANVSSYHELLFKDAVYAAVGLGVQSIYGRLDFEIFVANRLVPEISNKEPSFRILRRRIAWLLGKWVDVGISADTRVAIYQGLLDLLSNETDMVVRLTAAHSLKAAIDDWDFEISILLPFLGMAMDQVLKLLSEVEETDTIMKLVADLNAVIDRTGEHMVPHAPRIIEILVPYWSRAEEEPLFQSALVVTFTKIAGILKEQSTGLQQLFLPIIQYAVDRNNKAHVYLLEDALDLWWTILQTTPSSNPQLQSLVPSAINLLDYDNESLRKVLKIIESYILLDASAVLQQFGPTLFAGLATYVGSENETAAAAVSHAVEVILQACPVQIYGDMLLQSGLIGNVLNVFFQNKLPVYALMSYMGIFSRLAVCDAGYLINFLRLAGQQIAPGTDFLDSFLDKWLDKFDTIGHPRARKLTAIALANMLATQDPVLLNKLSSLMAIWTDVLAEIRNAEEDAFLYDEADMQGDLAELDISAEKDRRMELRTNDPVYTTDLAAALRHLLAECERRAGGAAQFQQMYLSKVDRTLLEQMNMVLSDQQ